MKTLKDVLTERNLENINIMYRTNSPIETEEDMLKGYCRYENGKLIPLDFDIYCLEDTIIKHEIDKDANGVEFLVVWVKSEWVSSAEEFYKD